MYSRQEAAAIHRKFWTVFGQYLKPTKNANGETINWVNYKTGRRHCFIKMQVDRYQANISLQLHHPDLQEQQSVYEILYSGRSSLSTVNEHLWSWDLLQNNDDGKTISQICKNIKNVNIYDEHTWPAIISFLKPQLIALDGFWLQMVDFIP